MGVIMAMPLAAASALCCCCQGLSCACSTVNVLTCCCRGALGRRTGISPRMAKLFYISLLGLATVLAIILRFNATNLDLGPLSVSCSGGNTSVTALGLTEGTYVYCKGDAAVFRISFILALFFALLMVLSVVSEGAHRGYWLLKILLLAGGMTGAFFMGADDFDQDAYTWVARIGSVFFLVLQILVLIDFAYQWNESWVARAYADPVNPDLVTNKGWLSGILVGALALFLVALGGLIVLYVFYSSCNIGTAFTTITLIAAVVITVLTLFRDRLVGEPGAVLPAAVVVAYIVFLCWSSLESNPDTSCRPYSNQTAASITLGAIFATVTLLWTTFSVTSNAGHLVKGEDLELAEDVQQKEGGMATSDDKPVPAPVKKKKKKTQKTGGPIVQEDLEDQAAPPPPPAGQNGEEEDDDAPIYSTEKPWTFHLIMLCASMYVAMLLTDWGNYAATQLNITAGTASMWVKITAQWVTITLFTWTLIAPGVLKHRDFSS